MESLYPKGELENLIQSSPDPIYERYLVDLLDLKNLYEEYLEPHIGAYGLVINKPKVIMAEFFRLLEGYETEEYSAITDLVEDIILPTDVKDWFVFRFNQIMLNLASSLNQQMQGKIIVDYSYTLDYKLVVNVVKYNY